MSTAEQENLKQVVKDAIREAFTENREMVKELLAEVVLDIASAATDGGGSRARISSVAIK